MKTTIYPIHLMKVYKTTPKNIMIVFIFITKTITIEINMFMVRGKYLKYLISF